MEAMNRLGYDAMALGLTDFSLGREALVARAKEASFALVSANVLDSATGEPLFPAHVVLQQGGHKIAVVGLTGLDDMVGGRSLGLKATDPIASARVAVARAREEADAVIVLSHLTKYGISA